MTIARVLDGATVRGPSSWIWSPSQDLAVFGGGAVLAALLGLGLRGGGAARMSDGLWLVFVLAVDVAHVWSTLFRTYLDREEFARRRALYLSLPLACYALGVLLHHVSSLAFWRALAYVAVFHFVRQQVGWVAIARARAGVTAALDRRLDEAVVYLATGVPMLHWHASHPRAFEWFVEGDFVGGPAVAAVAKQALRFASVAQLLAMVAYLVRSVAHARGGRPMWGKHLVVASTALLWWLGIVATNDDVTFTITNVLPHGLPYFVLLWRYTRARGEERPGSLVGRVARAGIVAFFTVALAFAWLEELAWDRLVWHDRERVFGVGVTLPPWLVPFLVPLLALPQAVHYALDGLLWRRKDGGAAQARALGFG
ncbi:MAG: hypothetical protein FJ096_16985 [Deltaproteobacteria bacterium]|nr:hypothetical protein [Deltaproteobacteria bacterium]